VNLLKLLCNHLQLSKTTSWLLQQMIRTSELSQTVVPIWFTMAKSYLVTRSEIEDFQVHHPFLSHMQRPRIFPSGKQAKRSRIYRAATSKTTIRVLSQFQSEERRGCHRSALAAMRCKFDTGFKSLTLCLHRTTSKRKACTISDHPQPLLRERPFKYLEIKHPDLPACSTSQLCTRAVHL
jgi:hypothetical protein